MLESTETFRDKMKIHGKKIDVCIQYEDTVFHKNEFISLEQNINGELFTSVCRVLTLELEKVENVTFEKETEINIKLGVKIDDDEEYEYVDWGKFVIYDVKDCVDTKSHKLTLYDHLIDTHIKYQDEPLSLDYSNDDVTVKDLLQAICNKFGFTLKTLSFANSNKIIHEDKYLNLDVTYRDILDEIAGCAGGFIKIFNKDLYVAYPQETGEIIGEEDLKSLDIGNKVGAFNTLVLARAPQEDNIFYPANMENNNNRVAIRIENNQIMDKNREDFIVNLYNKINGLEYYVFECEHYGFGYFEFGDIVTIKDLDGNSYKTILLNIIDNINTGITGKSYAEETEFAETKYEYASSLEKRIKNTEIICDKQNGEIKLLVKEQAKQEEKVAKIELDINTVKTTVGQQTTKIENLNSEILKEVAKTYLKKADAEGNFVTIDNLQTQVEQTIQSDSVQTLIIGSIDLSSYAKTTNVVLKNEFTQNLRNNSLIIKEVTKDVYASKDDLSETNKKVTENTSAIEQTAKSIALTISNNQTSAGIKIELKDSNGNTISEQSGTITVTGFVKFSDLSGNGTTTINGANIKTGTISASHLDTSTINAKSGTIAGLNIVEDGLFYSGTEETDGSGMNKGKTNANIAFYAGARRDVMYKAPFKILQDGTGTIGGFRIGTNVLESDSVGISANERWAFWTKIGGTTTSRISWNGDIECASIMVGGTPLVRSVTTSGQFISQIRHMTSYLEYTVDGYGAFGINGVWQSDTKLKKNIEDTKMSGLDFVNQIRHIEFDWKRDDKHEKIGYSANNLKEIDEDVVFAVEQPEGCEYDSLLQIDKAKVIPYLSKAVQEEDKKVNNHINTTNSKLEEVFERLDKIENLLKREV